MAFFGRKSPLEALGCKYRQIRERRREAQSKKVTERELTALHNKIVRFSKILLFSEEFYFFSENCALIKFFGLQNRRFTLMVFIYTRAKEIV